MHRHIACFFACGFLLAATAAHAEDAFFRVPIANLKLTEGTLPEADEQISSWANWGRRESFQPRVVLEGEGEAYLERRDDWRGRWDNETGWQDAIVAHAPARRDVAGYLFLRDRASTGMVRVKFLLPAAEGKSTAGAFYQAKEAYYEWLLSRQIAGGAWFRHEAREAQNRLQKNDATRGNTPFRARRNREVSDTFDLFTGGRAVRENLQLDRELLLRDEKANEELVDVDSIDGITVKEIDWQPLLKGAEPELDPLARLIPADQHALFFPSFTAAIQLSDEVDRQGTPLARLAVSRSEDELVRQRYERQLCLPLSDLARLLGPQVIGTVAVTGGDPYLFTGADVAVLFESKQPAALQTLLLGRAALAAKDTPDARPISGEADGLAYSGFRSPDRRVCCYIAKLAGAVVVTNSPAQLSRLAAVGSGAAKPLTSLDEYKFFRQRYPRGDASETALFFLSDPTIRRWCGPRWRIAASRRLRQAAVMSELTAEFMDRLVSGEVKPGPIHTDLPAASGDELRLAVRQIVSEHNGTLAFQTPIIELPLDRVTQAERDAYENWRRGYQSNWRWAFDPIGLRISIAERQLGADLTVMPLIWGSDYRQLVGVSQGASIGVDGADRHPSLAQIALALNPESPVMQSYGRLAAGTLQGNPLSWVGSSVSVYADDGEFWTELAKQESPQAASDYTWKHLGDMPVAIYVDVANAVKLTAMMTAVRTMVDQTAPGMTLWEPLSYRDEPYVRVGPTARARRDLRGAVPEAARPSLYYAFSADGLLLTPCEPLLKRYLDRVLLRREPGKAAAQENAEADAQDAAARPIAGPWLGDNLCLHLDRKAIQMLVMARDSGYRRTLEERSWSNLPILNEWHRRYPMHDPVEVHEQVWATRLTCPGGGKYVWNDEWQTMESTVLGHPGQPKPQAALPDVWSSLLGGSFGITFENQGLRAKAEITR
ncbi:MAG TPA: hypothetical protein VF306_17300 [Pirellulales bacterium]